MKASVEISLYPLNQDFKEIILAFIKKLHETPGLTIETNTMSTQIFGDYDTIISLLSGELKEVFSKTKAVAVLKIIGHGLPD